MIEAMAYEGGGVRVICEVGGHTALWESGELYGLKATIGTSAGGFMAILVGLGYTPKEIKAAIESCDFASFEDGNFLDIALFFEKFGVHPGIKAQQWIESLIFKKTGKDFATFQDLKNMGYLDINIIACSLRTRYYKVFNAINTPDRIVSEACRASMSIPMYFWAFHFSNDPTKELFVDGGTLLNYGIDILNKEFGNMNVLGLYLKDEGPNNFPDVQYGNFKGYVESAGYCALESQDIFDETDPGIMKQTVYLNPLNESAINFKITAQRQDEIFNSGYAGGQKYIQSLKV